MLGYYSNSRSADHQCPRCTGSVMRIKRYWADRLISAMFCPVYRFRCEQLGCHWEGRLKVLLTQTHMEPFLRQLTDERMRRAPQPLPPDR